MQSKSSLIYKCKLYCFNYIVLFNGMKIFYEKYMNIYCIFIHYFEKEYKF